MSLRFAAARPAAYSGFVARAQQFRIAATAVNDNAGSESEDDMVRAALKHFARVGLAAATDARDRAREAHFAGDRAGYLYWLAVCRKLDKRMAMALASNLARPRHR